MPFLSVTLQPGVNSEATPTALQAGFLTSQFVRFRAGFVEKLGGWLKFFQFALAGVPRAMQAWLDLNGNTWLAVGTTQTLGVINSNNLTTITPQTFTSNAPPNIQTTASSKTVTITDTGVTNPTTFDTIFFNTPVSVGGIVLSGAYAINTILGPSAYSITAGSAATLTRSLASITNITNANPAVVTAANGFASTDLIYIYGVTGMTQVNGQLYAISAVSGSGFTLTGINSSGFGGYISGGSASEATVPEFTTDGSTAIVTVTFPNHGLVAGNSMVFPIATSVGGLTIQGTYTVLASPAPTTNTFSISANANSTSAVTAMMNSGNIQIVYYIALGPISTGTGYSFSTYSSGTYSGVGGAGSALTGNALSTTDWTFDNWGSTLLACPVISGQTGGPIFQWTPNTGLQTAQIIPNAPILNSGIVVAVPAQILIAYGSTVQKAIGVTQDPLTYNWSDQLDYTYWTPGGTNPNTHIASQAGNNRIPTGSAIKAAIAAPQQVLMWTDLDLWSITYVGNVNAGLIFAQTKIGSNCGAVSRHCVAQMRGGIFWMGVNNFFMMGGGAPTIIPCSVWDAVFQNLDKNNLDKCFAVPFSSFDEIVFFYPSLSGGTGQCDSYVKFNLVQQAWDLGTLARSAGIGQSVLGNPIIGSPAGIIFQHESGYNNDTAPLTPSFTTGYFYLSEGEDFVYVDQILPDFHYQTISGSTPSASIQISFSVIKFMGDTPVVYGPFNMNSSTPYLSVRFRGRQAAITVTSSDVGSWWRLGKIRMRYSTAGRR